MATKGKVIAAGAPTAAAQLPAPRRASTGFGTATAIAVSGMILASGSEKLEAQVTYRPSAPATHEAQHYPPWSRRVQRVVTTQQLPSIPQPLVKELAPQLVSGWVQPEPAPTTMGQDLKNLWSHWIEPGAWVMGLVWIPLVVVGVEKLVKGAYKKAKSLF